MKVENPPLKLRAKSLQVLAALPLFPCLFLTACVLIPMKMRTLVKPVIGEDLHVEPDTTTIHAGVTTRADVLQQFAAFDTGWKGERLFLGRWLRSRFSANVDSSNGRLWVGNNLVVEFDEHGTVTKYRVLSDQEFLDMDHTWLWTSESDLPGFQEPAGNQPCNKLDLPGNRQPACGASFKLVNVLGKELLEISGACPGAPLLCEKMTYRIAVEQIEGLDAEHWYGAASDIVKVYPPVTNDFVLSLHLKERIRAEGSTENGGKNTGAKTLTLDTDIPNVLMLLHFLQIKNAK